MMQIFPNLLRVIFMLSTIVYVTDCCSSRILLLRRHTLTFVQHVHQHPHPHPHHQHQNHDHASSSAASLASQLQQKQPQHVNFAASDGREFNKSRSGEFHGRQDDHNNSNNNDTSSADDNEDGTEDPDVENEVESITEWASGIDLRLESDLETEFESRFESIMDIKPEKTRDKLNLEIESKSDLKLLSESDLKIESKGDQKLELKSDKKLDSKSDLKIESNDDKFEFKSDKKLELKSDLKLESEIELKSDLKADFDPMSVFDRLFINFNDTSALGGGRLLSPPTDDHAPSTLESAALGLGHDDRGDHVAIVDPAIREQQAASTQDKKNPKYHVIDFYYTIMRDVLSFECIGQFLTDFCLNGGRCFRYPIGNHSFFSCECADGFVGERCESKSVNELYLPSTVAPPKILMARMVFSFPMLVVLCVVYGAIALVIMLRGPLKRGSIREEGVLEG